jgi:hypothetical protein
MKKYPLGGLVCLSTVCSQMPATDRQITAFFRQHLLLE